MASKNYSIFIVFIVFAVILFFPKDSSAVSYTTGCGETMTIGTSYAQCCVSNPQGGCVSGCTQYSCSGSWDEYKVESTECGADILVRNCRSVCGSGSACCGCGPCQVQCTSPEVYKEVGSWQKAEREEPSTCGLTSWGLDVPEVKCQGECISTPANSRYYDNPSYPTSVCSPEPGKSSKDVYLPVKLDWDDVEGWKSSWCEAGKQEGCSEECVQSYGMRITTSTDPSLSDVLGKSEYIPEACLLPSNNTTNWAVKACCGVDGTTNCGPESSWSLSTNYAPEPVSPYDPDWTGKKGGENVSLPTTLDWCDVKEAESYRFKVYVIEGGKKVCHPDLLSTSEGKEVCDSWLLRKTRRNPAQIDRILYSDFFDENMDFFTKNTEYAWQTTICDENGLDCKIDSQLWTFFTKEVPLETSFLVAPTDDPTGKIPVGLPLVIDWNDKPGVNSFIYEVVPVSGGQNINGNTRVSQSKSFDSPQLSLNTLYKWKVKSCWDYQAENCEPEFSEEWYFKTTGQAPNLTYPAAGEQKVVIPVNFKWEEVPGAKSYIFKITGDGLNLEEILDKSEFSLDYPDYPIHQETNYSWQVKTCAWEKGKTCGGYSAVRTFKTFRLSAPANPSPPSGGELSTSDRFLAWQEVPGAKTYQYQIKYLSLAENEEDETCPPLVGKDVFEQPATAPGNSAYVELGCLGEYQWQVRSCLDGNCQELSNWSDSWNFVFVESSETAGLGGLVPCGRNTNNPKTPWNERESCEIKHIFLLVKIMVDFLLFKLAPIILVLLVLITGGMFYFSISTGGTNPIVRVKSLWKSAGIGLGIMFFAWVIVNLFLKLVGYQIGIFGNWYQLPI